MAWCCTVAQAKQQCTVAEFHRWAVYEGVEPFGDFWLMQQNASLMGRVFNATRGKGERAYKFADFMPMHEGAHAGQTQAEMLTQWKVFVRRHNAAIKAKADGNDNRKT